MAMNRSNWIRNPTRGNSNHARQLVPIQEDGEGKSIDRSRRRREMRKIGQSIIRQRSEKASDGGLRVHHWRSLKAKGPIDILYQLNLIQFIFIIKPFSFPSINTKGALFEREEEATVTVHQWVTKRRRNGAQHIRQSPK